MASDVKFTIGGDNKAFLKSLQASEKAVVKTGETVTNTFRAVGAVAGAALSAWGVKELVAIADQYTLLNGRLKLVTGSTEELTKAQDTLYAVSQQTRQEYGQTVTLYTNLARATKDLDLSQQSLVGITELLNQAFVVSGASQEESANSMRQFNQAMQGGIVRAEEYNSMLEQTPRVLEAVADGLGVTMGQLREMMKAGKLSSEVFLEGLRAGGEKVRREFEQMPLTVGQALTTLENAFKGIVDDANQTSGATDSIAESIKELADTVDRNRETIVGLFSGIVEGAGWVIDVFGDMATEIKVMTAVAAGELDVLEYIGMSMQDMRAWVDDWESGTAATLGRIAVLQDKIADLERSPRANWAINREKLKGYRAELVTLYAELDSKQQQYADKSVKTEQKANAAKVTGAKKTTTAICKENEKRLSCAEKAAKKEQEARDKLLQDQLSASYTLSKQVEKAQQDTNDAILADLDQLMEDEKELWEGGNAEIVKLNELLVNDLGRIGSSFVEDVLRGELDTVGDMFESLFDSILDMFIRLLGQIAANSLVEAMGLGGTGGLSIQGLLGGGNLFSTAGTAAQGVSIAGAAQQVGSWLGIGGGTAVAPYVAGGGQMLGSAAVPVTITGAAPGALPTGMGFSYGGSAGSGSAAVGAGLSASMLTVAAIPAIVAMGELLGTKYERYDDGAVRVRSGDPTADYTRSMQDSLASLNSALERSGDSTKLYESTLNMAETRVRYLANTLGDATAQASLGVEGTVESMDGLLDSLLGYDLAQQDSASILWLAKEAVEGTAGATDAMRETLIRLGMQSDDAATAVIGIVSALNDIPDEISIDVKVNQDIIDSINHKPVVQISGTTSSYAGSGSGFEYSDWLQSNYADGGIMTRPTVFHVGGEAGAEAITPLHNGPDTLKIMDAKLDALADRPIIINIQGDAAGLERFIKVVADEHRVQVNQAGLDPLQRAF